MYDVVIIGAGVSGSAIASELSKYNAKIAVLERAEDVCCGTTKANSGIVHAGYDAQPGSMMAKLNVRGNEKMTEISQRLNVSFQRNGSLLVCRSLEEIQKLEELKLRGEKNGVKGLQILMREELLSMEPNLSDEVVAGLYAPTAGIVCPFGLNLAFAEHAYANGVEFHFYTKVTGIEETDGGYTVQTTKGAFPARVVVNAAGVFADEIHNMVCEEKMHITPRKGEYFLLDRSEGAHVGRTIFALPTKLGKGILVTPTVHGNLLLGPTAMDIENKEGTDTTRDGLDMVMTRAGENVKNLAFRKVITSFAGLRAHEANHDFIIEEAIDHPGFIDCAGIESPGLTSAPAIGEMVACMVQEKLQFELNPTYTDTRKGILNPEHLSIEDRHALIQKQPAYGNIICRCEMISEGEILDAIHRPLGAKTLDGLKRRVRAGSGRCQSGFCAPKSMEILVRELGVSMEEITKSGADSKLIVGINKDQIS